ncbi:hypothetical protein ACTFIW_011394 [Dictyostelium discoideum]
MYIDQLIEKAKKRVTILFDECPLFINDSLIFGEMDSLTMVYDIISYDSQEHCFTKKSERGTCSGVIMNNVYFKTDNGCGLLRPAKENAVFEFYKGLYPESSKGSSFVSPTNFMILTQIPILPSSPIECSKRKELIEFKSLYKTNRARSVYLRNLEFERDILNSRVRTNVSTQASLLVKGEPLDKLIEKNRYRMKQFEESLDNESFGAHILSSLLLITTDYKPDNIFIESATNKIIGIDNDECMEFYEIQQGADGNQYVHFKNILFLLRDKMSTKVNQKIREQYLKHQPNTFILSWLLKILEKDKNYKNLVDLAFPDDQSLLRNETNSSLKLPFTFKKGWINSMLSRFKLIKSLLKLNNYKNGGEIGGGGGIGSGSGSIYGIVTYQDLFKEVLPLAYFYYQQLERESNGDPINQIRIVYERELSFGDLLFKDEIEAEPYKTMKFVESKEISIIETIKELILNSGENDFESPPDYIKWLEQILMFKNSIDISGSSGGVGEIKLHESFYKSTKSIIANLFKGEADFKLINDFINFTNFNIKELSEPTIFSSSKNDDGANEIQQPLLHSTIYSNNLKLFDQIKFIINNLNVNIDLVNEKGLTALDLSAELNNFKLFILLIELGGGKVFNSSIISKFYNSLRAKEKLEFKPYLQVLFHTNPNAAWCISLNCLLPEYSGSQLDLNRHIKTISTVVKGRRKISGEHFYSLFDRYGEPLKTNQYGSSAVPSIRDEYGNCIYIKFNPQFPGTDIAVSKLSEYLFGHCSPCCELGSIEGQPILLVQEVYGEPLINVLEKTPEIIDKLDPLNISKQLIMGILTNNADGNLGNFIITPTSKKPISKSTNNLEESCENKFKIYSIDNEQCFMPSTLKQTESDTSHLNKSKLQVETAILLFNQMNDNVHQEVIKRIKSLDINEFCKKWLGFLEKQNSLSLVHFKELGQQLKNQKKTIVGVNFVNEMMKTFYTKLERLKHLTISEENITHLQLLEKLEPMIADRIKPILISSANESIIKRYWKLKNGCTQTIIVRNSSYNLELTRSNNPSAFLAQPIDKLNPQDIENQLWEGHYGPEKALRELKEMEIEFSKISQIFNNINDGAIDSISDLDLTEFLKKTSFDNLSKVQSNKIFETLKSRSINIIHIKNCENLKLRIFKQFNLEKLTEIDLSGCTKLKCIRNGLNTTLVLASLKILIVRNCAKLMDLKLKADNLETLIASDCSKLKEFEVNSPNLKNLNLNSSINNPLIFNCLKKYKKLTFLDISNSKGIPVIEFDFQELKFLDAKSISVCNKVILDLPKIELIIFEGCKDLREIKSKSNHHLTWKALKSDSNKLIFHEKQINLNLIGPDLKELPIGCESEIELIDPNHFQLYYSDGDEMKNNQEKNYYKIKSLVIGNIPKTVKSLIVHDSFCHVLSPGIIPDSVKTLNLYDIKAPLDVGSIPSSVKSLILNKGFGRILTEDIIPNGVENLDIYDIKLQLEIKSIPSSVISLKFHDGFNHGLEPGIIPNGVRNLQIQNLKKPLVIGSIPQSVNRLTINQSVQFKLIPNIIPSSVNFLYLYDVKEELKIGSIPSNVKSLALNYKFNSPLSPYIIPDGVETLDLYDLLQPLQRGSIPSSVDTLTIHDGFNQVLRRSIIPNSVKTLHLHDIKQNLQIGSIPSSVKKLILHDKFNQHLSIGIIPEGVEYLSLHNIIQNLETGSIPKTMLQITFEKSFDKSVPPFVIPSGTKLLYANNN